MKQKTKEILRIILRVINHLLQHLIKSKKENVESKESEDSEKEVPTP